MATSKVYGKAMQTLLNKEWDFDSDTIVAALCSSSYAPDQDTHDYADDITNELAVSGYSRVTLSGKTVTYTAGTNTIKLDCDDFAFPSMTTTDVRYIVFFADTGADSVSPLILYLDLGAAVAISSNVLNVAIATAGLITITVA